VDAEITDAVAAEAVLRASGDSGITAAQLVITNALDTRLYAAEAKSSYSDPTTQTLLDAEKARITQEIADRTSGDSGITAAQLVITNAISDDVDANEVITDDLRTDYNSEKLDTASARSTLQTNIDTENARIDTIVANQNLASLKSLEDDYTQKFNTLIDSGSALDTISELKIAWEGQDTNLQNTLNSAIGLKANKASPTFSGTVAGISKSMVGLGSVDNIADTAKPISTLTQSALDLKAPLANPIFSGTVAGVSKSMVGLGSVNNVASYSTSQADTLLGTKRNNADSYTKTEVDAKDTTITGNLNAEVQDRQSADNLKANKSTTYTKTEVDAKDTSQDAAISLNSAKLTFPNDSNTLLHTTHANLHDAHIAALALKQATLNTASLYLDTSNNRVGINKSTPARSLDILNADGTPQLRLSYNNGNYMELGVENNEGDGIIKCAGANLIIDRDLKCNQDIAVANGVMTIGTATQERSLHILNADGNPQLRLSYNGGNYMELGVESNSGDGIIKCAGAKLMSDRAFQCNSDLTVLGNAELSGDINIVGDLKINGVVQSVKFYIREADESNNTNTAVQLSDNIQKFIIATSTETTQQHWFILPRNPPHGCQVELFIGKASSANKIYVKTYDEDGDDQDFFYPGGGDNPQVFGFHGGQDEHARSFIWDGVDNYWITKL
jgi:hypothetical protein